MNKALQHFNTINKHRWKVFIWCCKMGIPFRGILHDLSKYSWAEFSIYKWYSGNKSPHDNCREELGFSPSWLHHKARNKHHWEYWLDNEKKEFIPVKIPYKYVVEMFCDFVGAGQTYMKEKWNCASPFEYHLNCKANRLFHIETLKLLELLLMKLAELDVKDFHKWYKKNKKELKINYVKEK